jgi:hypothetical protein
VSRQKNTVGADGSTVQVYPYGQGISAGFAECRHCGGRVPRWYGRHRPCEESAARAEAAYRTFANLAA